MNAFSGEPSRHLAIFRLRKLINRRIKERLPSRGMKPLSSLYLGDSYATQNLCVMHGDVENNKQSS